MLEIDMLPQKGILFVCLKGVLNKKNSNKFYNEVTELLKKAGIRNVVFNIEEISYIDKYGEKVLQKCLNMYRDNKEGSCQTK